MKPAIGGIAALSAVGVAYLATNTTGAAGMAVGLFVSFFNLGGLWVLILLAGHAAKGSPAPMRGAMLAVGGFLLKLPLFVAGVFLARRLGEPAPGCFLAAVALVYSSLIGWALARR